MTCLDSSPGPSSGTPPHCEARLRLPDQSASSSSSASDLPHRVGRGGYGAGVWGAAQAPSDRLAGHSCPCLAGLPSSAFWLPPLDSCPAQLAHSDLEWTTRKAQRHHCSLSTRDTLPPECEQSVCPARKVCDPALSAKVNAIQLDVCLPSCLKDPRSRYTT